MNNVGKTLTVTYDNSSTYLTASGGCKVKYSALGNNCILANPVTGNANGYGTLTASAMDALFPNAAAHPTSISVSALLESGNSNSYIALEFDETEVARQNAPTSAGVRYFNSSAEKVTGSSKGSSIRFHTHKNSSLTWCDIQYSSGNELVITLYFNRYDFSAVGMGGVSASVSSATGFDGDSITWSANVQSGYSFDGWYSDAARTQLVSTALSYTETVNGVDRTLYAKCHLAAKTLTVSYDGGNIVSRTASGQSVSVSYNGVQLFTISSGSKTLNCAGKFMSGNIVVDGSILNCSGKLMNSNVTVTMS